MGQILFEDWSINGLEVELLTPYTPPNIVEPTTTVARNLFRRGTKGRVPSAAGSIQAQNPKHEKYGDNFIECTYILFRVRQKNFQRGTFGVGHVPLPYAPGTNLSLCYQINHNDTSEPSENLGLKPTLRTQW